jgi:hypothetical protein
LLVVKIDITTVRRKQKKQIRRSISAIEIRAAALALEGPGKGKLSGKKRKSAGKQRRLANLLLEMKRLEHD